MGLLTWLRGRREGKSLVRVRYDDPRQAEVERDAAADIAAVEQDDKYFDPHSPGQEPGE